MTQPLILIAGGGIGGMATALTLHQIGVPCLVLESVKQILPLGVGINIQPNGVRELFDLGFTEEDMDQIGVKAQEWSLVGLNGNDIYSEPRGLLAGYDWPQYAVHRGQFQMMLYREVLARLGAEAVQLDHRVVGYEQSDSGVTALVKHRDGSESRIEGTLLIGVDGLHSAVRAQMYPSQPRIHWGGALMWRGTSMGVPIRTGSSFVGLGTHRHRLIFYPITRPDPATGLAVINWIAEITVDIPDDWEMSDWNKRVELSDVLPHFQDWCYDWLDAPALLSNADAIYEFPMIDRDPVPTWCEGRVALLGDAAHVMYPTGSNGASQAIIDARVLGASLLKHGVTPEALAAYDEELCYSVSALVLRNRGAGPFGLLNLVNERCGGKFENIDDVISPEERNEFMSGYKAAAGFAMEKLNSAPPTIPEGAKIRV